MLTVKIRVYSWWKGFDAKEITLLTGKFKLPKGVSTRTSEDTNFTVGEEILVFANGEDKNRLQTHSCSGIGEIKFKSEFLKILGAGRSPK